MGQTPNPLPPQVAALALLAMVAVHVRFPLSTAVAMPLSLVGLVLLAGGGAGVVWARPVLVVPFFVLVLWHRFMRPEEKLLETTFGERYRAYRASVRRWV